jgi:hypothetical protein
MPTSDTQGRRRRAAIAERLLARSPTEAAALDWDALDQAPDWLALPEQEFAALQCRVGAILHAPNMRLWIDGARIAAARAAVGEQFLRQLLADSTGPSLPRALSMRRRIDAAAHVGLALAGAGAAVLLAALPPGPLRDAATAILAPSEPAEIHPQLAQATLSRVRALAAVTTEVAP